MADQQTPPKPQQPPADQPPSAPGPATAASAPKPAGPITDKAKLPKVKEIGGPEGPEPTRYGDWEVKGRVSDF
jgi:homeobox protein ESX1